MTGFGGKRGEKSFDHSQREIVWPIYRLLSADSYSSCNNQKAGYKLGAVLLNIGPSCLWT